MNIKTKFTKILTCREANDTEQKMKFSIEDFFSKCEHETADLVTFTEEILHGKLHFLCSIYCMVKRPVQVIQFQILYLFKPYRSYFTL